MRGRPALEVADIFRAHGPAWHEAQRGHLSLAQLKVMSAITQCRTAALGGHVLRCDGCGLDQVSFNSCRNRHCPKCQSSAAKRWLDARQADLLPVEYYHVVFTLPAPIADIAYQNKATLYGLLFDIAAETLLRIAADPKHLGASIGATLVLHTWGSALTHHPHVHGIVPGGGLAPDGTRWIACRPGFFLSVRVLSRLFRRRFLEELQRLHDSGALRFFGEHTALAEPAAFKAWLAPLRKCEWVVYAKRPFAGPQAVLAYLSRYTHRVAISNSRLLAMDERGVTFRWKDYRAKGQTRHKAMTLSPQEFMRRFLLHVLPGGFHRIRHYGLLANSNRRDNLALARELLLVPPPACAAPADDASTAPAPTFVCAHCGHAMVVLQVFLRGCSIRAPPAS
ncbi:Putative transposase [Burkholderiales bacterium JOSHI_001]|nr:Putative transposase [Burkholderiales bacterium JOSHI_001]EHR71192.1 Putative transposase [Burkholderiales bacterium JOSHI_001]EHR71240.1 Putative transposase [Burkholderiales bacterium JOSHI_001]EHR71578.1 Putative transposase [Burkholderiales bacterium JOSHI_001]